jgi:hypothetical protein
MWIAPTPVDRTAGIGQEELELRDDGDIDGLQLTEAFGERAQRFLMLEHQLMSHHVVTRSTLLYCGEVEQCAQPRRNLSSLCIGTESGGTNHQLAVAPRVGPLRECRVDPTSPQGRADPGEPPATPTSRQGADPGVCWSVAHCGGA